MGMLCLNFSLFESAIFAFLMHTVILAIYWICIVRVECPMPGCTRGCTLLFCIVLLIWNFEDKPEAWAGQTSKPCLTMFKMNRVQKSICLKAQYAKIRFLKCERLQKLLPPRSLNILFAIQYRVKHRSHVWPGPGRASQDVCKYLSKQKRDTFSTIG